MATPSLSRRRRSRRPLLRLLFLLLLVGAVWGAGLVRFADSLPDTVEAPDTRTDAIVVLTGGSGRLNIGFDLLSEDRAEKLFISGVFPGTDIRQLLALVQREPHYLAARVNIGTAINTVGNARETADWMGEQGYASLRLVTAGYHMPRSLLEFRRALPDAKILPHPVFPEHVKQDEWWAWPGTSSLILREYNKFLLAWLRHTVVRVTSGSQRPPAKESNAS